MNSKYIKIIVIVLLTFNAVSALIAGWLMMMDTTGQSMGFNVEMLRFSPFKDFFIPGLVLFFSNGVLSSIAIISIVTNHKNAYTLMWVQGTILAGWICGQILMLRMIEPLHLLMGGVGVILIYTGFKGGTKA